MDNIKLVRLVTGEELLCEITDNIEKDGYDLKNILIVMVADANKLGFAPYMPYTEAENGLHISGRHIMFIVDAKEELVNQYKQVYNKIITPNSGIALPRIN